MNAGFAALAFCLWACSDRASLQARAKLPPLPPISAAVPSNEVFLGAVQGAHSKARYDTLVELRSYGDSLNFRMVTHLALTMQDAIVSDQFSSPHVAVVERQSGRVLSRFGEQGNDVKNLYFPTWFSLPESNRNSLWVYDSELRRLSEVVSRSAKWQLSGNEVHFRPDISLQSPVWTDRGLISNGIFSDYTLLTMDSSGRPMKRISNTPPFSTRQMPHANGLRMLNRTFLASNPPRTKIVLAYQWAGRLDFFNMNGEVVGSIKAPRRPNPLFHYDTKKFYWDKGSEMGYAGIAATSRYLYALFCGCKKDFPTPNSRIHVFDWNGRFLGELTLNREITALAVDESNRVLTGGSAGGDARLVEWALPKWLVSNP